MSGECDECGNHALECWCETNGDKMKEDNGWIKLSERKPPQDVRVLVAKSYFHKKRPDFVYYFLFIASRIGDQWFEDPNEDEVALKDCIITHWQPLPDKPEKLNES